VTLAFNKLAALVQSRTGMTVSRAKETALRLAVGRAAPGLDMDAFLHAIEDPVLGPGLVDRLIDEVTVHETSFARDMSQLSAIDWRGLQQAARAAGSGVIRVWCAGCASGEEAYTLALLASEALAPGRPGVDVIGTDVSLAMIAAAEAGHYRQRAVRELGPERRGRYLEELPDGTYYVGASLRSLVRFARHNLVTDPYPPRGESAFDLIVCRNVLIYFTSTLARRVVETFRRSVRPGGMVLLGAADVLQLTPAHGSAAGRRHEPARTGPFPARQPPGAGVRPQAGATAGARPEGVAVTAATGAAFSAGGAPSRDSASLEAAADRRLLTLTAAGAGDRDGALEHAASLAEAHPLDADAHFLYGLVALEAGEPGRARDALRRALCADPEFCLAAFTLGRAYDALGDRPAARRAYGQALRTLDPGDRKHESLLQQIDLADIAAACQARLEWHE
jgi:chemotaxis protein methyltransferase CheR